MAITTAAGVPINYGIYGTTVTSDSDPRTCNYTHFNLSSEQLGRTSRYNCWGFTFLPRRYWIDSDIDVDNIIRDNCVAVTSGSIRPGDVIRYRDDWNITTHTGRVWETDGAGNATLVRSKWGGWAEYLHLPADVPSIYGTHLAFFRQVLPLRGIADLWIKDSPADGGEQYSPVPWWTSPDILVDAPPYDGIPDTNPLFGKVNRVWTRISNRGDVAATNVYVRYYWADPSAGLAAASWKLIPGTTGHPNPAGPFYVPANGIIVATSVEWKPSASPAHQCLLSVAYINDDPRDSGNLDPLVYPFDVPWENSVGQRNVSVVTLKPGKKHKFSVFSSSPWRLRASTMGELQVVVAHSPRAAILAEPDKPVLLNVNVALEGGKALTFKRLGVTRCLPVLDLPNYRLLGVPVAMSAPQKVIFATKKRHRLVIELTVPKNASAGSTYYVHIVQRVGKAITGGYTVAVMVD